MPLTNHKPSTNKRLSTGEASHVANWESTSRSQLNHSNTSTLVQPWEMIDSLFLISVFFHQHIFWVRPTHFVFSTEKSGPFFSTLKQS